MTYRNTTRLGLALLAATALAACTEENIINLPAPDVEVVVSPATAELAVGETVQLEWTVRNADDRSVTITSNNTSIATVTAAGLVTAVGPGTTTIRVQSNQDPDARASATIVVRAPVTPDVQITLLPSEATINVGETIPLVATVTGSANTNVTFESSATNVATVSAGGLVEAHATGTAVITATAAADVTKKATSVITVVQPPAPSVSIQAVRTAAGVSVNPNNVAGLIDVHLNVNIAPGVAETIEVVLGGVVVCSQTVTSGAIGTIVCTINTADFDDETGAVAFLNGAKTLVARTTGAGSQAETDMQLVLNNPDRFWGRITASNGPVNDAGGLVWWGGNITVSALPVMYSGNTVANVTFTLPGFVGVAGTGQVRTPSRTTTDPATGVTFPSNVATTAANPGVASLNTGPGGTVPSITSVLDTGEPGPNTFLNPAGSLLRRIDNEAPAAGTLTLTTQFTGVIGVSPFYVDRACCSGSWVGADYQFLAGLAGRTDAPNVYPAVIPAPLTGTPGAPIAGVGGVTSTFHAGPPGTSNAALAASPPVETGSDLDPSDTNTAYIMRAVSRDALNNSAGTNLVGDGGVNDLTTFGIDHEPPTAEYDGVGGVRANQRFNQDIAFPYAITASDDRSGFSGTPVVARVARTAQTTTLATACPFGVNNIFGTPVGCLRLPAGLILNIGTVGNAAGGGYFTMGQVVVQDQAGNRVSLPDRTVLRDATAPNTGSVVVPPTLVGGQNATFSVQAEEDVDLWQADFRLEFPVLPFGANGELPLGGVEAPGTPFSETLLGSQNFSRSIVYVRSLETVDAADAPSGTIGAPNAATFRVRQAAYQPALSWTTNTETRVTAAFAGPAVGGTFATGVAATNVDEFTIDTSPTGGGNICNGGTGCGVGVPTSRTLVAQVTGALGTLQRPFDVVHFYRVDPDGVTRLIGSATSSQVSDAAGVRTYTWSTNFNPAGLQAQAAVSIFAVGIENVTGRALSTDENTTVNIVGTLLF